MDKVGMQMRYVIRVDRVTHRVVSCENDITRVVIAVTCPSAGRPDRGDPASLRWEVSLSFFFFNMGLAGSP